jgi:imidazolonepropionase-like amidohydrolase
MIRRRLWFVNLLTGLIAVGLPQAWAADGVARLETERVTAFVRVNLVPMDEPRVVREQTVIVRDGRIAAIGSGLAVPQGANVIDGLGVAYLSPGLADMHVHSDSRDDLAVYLAHGVTTIANMGGARSGFALRTKPAANRGAIAAPHVYASFIVDGAADHGHFNVRTPEQARAAVDLAKTNGYDFIKVYNDLAPEVFTELATQGKQKEMPLVGHGVTRVGLRDQLAAGQVLVAHLEEFFYTLFTEPGTEQTDTPPEDARIPDAIALLKRTGAAVGADLVTYDRIAAQIGHPEVLASYLAAPETRNLSPADRLSWRASGYVGKTEKLGAKLTFLRRMAKAMADADVLLLAGTDAPTVPGVFPGTSTHDNLRLLEDAGLTRYQALSTATRLPGVFIQRTIGGEPFGTVTVGARADLVLSKENPLETLASLRRPLGVMAGGVWRDAKALQALLDGVAQRYSAAELPARAASASR